MTSNRNEIESKAALKKCNYTCVICGWHVSDEQNHFIIEGAHLKAFSDDPLKDRRDNIIALCPNHHAMFDRYLFYIDSKSYNVIFKDTSNSFHNKCIKEKISYVKQEYLAFKQYQYNQYWAGK
ncbi:MAG: HNH endonuclease [Treponema sp.]|nr:HNH endonuclease [Treponema sp.]